MKSCIQRLILLALLLSSVISSKAQWVAENNGLYGGNIISFTASGSNLFAATGSGVFLSTDNGTSWTAVNNGLTGYSPYYITSMASMGTSIFAATGYGVFLSTDNGTSWAPAGTGLTATVSSFAVSGTNIFAGTYTGGVFISTDNGISWSPVNTGLTSLAIKSLATNGSNIVAGTGLGVFLSTNNGGNWTAIDAGLADNFNANSLAMSGSNIFAGTQSGGVSLSTDNGTSWTAVNTGLPSTNISFLGINGTNVFAGTNGGGVYLSTDNGTSWSAANSGLGYTAAYAYATVKSFASIGTNIFVGTSYDGGGVFLSTNNGTSWTAANTGLASAEVHSLTSSGSNIFAGTGNGVYLSTDGTSWTAVNTGIPEPSDVYSVAISGSNIFAGTYGSGVFLSTDNGTSWTGVNTGLTTPYIYSLATSGTNLFAGTAGGGIFLSTDNGTSWNAVNTGLTNTTVQAIVTSGSNIFAGTQGGVFVSTNSGTSWTAVNSGLTDLIVLSMAISGSNIFVGTNSGGVFLSIDNGTSWAAVNTGLTYSHIESLAISGSNLFAGTNGQVFFSSNNGTSWTQVNSVNGLVNTNFPSLTISGNNIFAGTDVGVWSRPLSDFNSAPSTPVAIAPSNVFNLAKPGFTANWNSVSGATNYFIDIATDAGFTSIVSGYNNLSVASPQTSADVTDLFGSTTYYYRVRASNASGTSGNSNVISILTIPSQTNATPATNITTTGFTANWNTVNGATGYFLNAATGNYGNWLPGYNLASESGTSQAITGLLPGTTYVYQVASVNSTGAVIPGNGTTVTTLPLAATPASGISTTGFTANWTSVSSATAYQLDVSTDNFSTFVSGYDSLVVGGTSQVVSGLSAGTAYQYRTRATNALGISGNSYVVLVTTANGVNAGSSNELDPVHAGSLLADGAWINGALSLYVSGNYAYLPSPGGLEIADVTIPTSPIHKGKYPLSVAGQYYVTVSGNYAYVINLVDNSLEIVNVSNPAAPVFASRIVTGSGGANLNGPRYIRVSGNYAYIINGGSSSLEIFDVTNPAAPVQKGILFNGEGGAQMSGPRGLFVSGNYAYVVSPGSQALEIIDVSNPTSPVHAGSINNGAGGALLVGAYSVYVSGNYAYVASSSSNALEIINVTNAAAPTHAGSLVDGTGGASLVAPLSVSVSGNYAYVSSTGSNALEVVNVTTPTAPVHAGIITNGTGGAMIVSSWSVQVSGTHVYLTSQGSIGALEIVDVSNPSSPTHAGDLIAGAGATVKLFGASSVYVSRNMAYVTANINNALEIADVTNPSSPVHKGSIADGAGGALLNNPNSVFVSGNYAYVASIGSNALEIVDVSVPTAPIHKGSIVDGAGGATIKSPWSVFVAGNYAYVTSTLGDALEIIDVSNPSAPVHKGSIADGAGGASLAGPGSVFVSGNYAYVAVVGSNALEIVDISNPANPTHKGSILNGAGGAMISIPNSVYVSGNYAYLTSTGSSALEIVDVTNPAAPVHKGSLADGGGTPPFLGYPSSVYVSGNFAYVTDGNNSSLEVVDVTNPASPIHAGSITDGNGGAVLVNPTSVFYFGNHAYVVDGQNNDGTGSNALEIVSIFNPAPATPVAAAVSSISSTGFTIGWNSISGATSYQLDISTDNFNTFVAGYNSLTVAGTSQVVTGLSPGTTYQYQVRAIAPSGITGNSNVITGVTIPPTPVAGPADPNPSPTTFVAQWGAATGATSYNITVATDPSFVTNILASYNNLSVGNVTSITISGLNSLTTYYYQVSATNAGGTSAFSSAISVTTTSLSITGFSPTSGSAGTPVTITGINFDPTPANNTIQFNGIAAIVTASTSTSITTIVPLGATTGLITVTVAGQTATSATSFSIVTSATDSLALVALYNSTNGANWTNKTNWLTGALSTWFGVTVSGGRVISLAGLGGNNLAGTIPVEIGNLTALTNINFGDNALTGSIPHEIGNLTSLQFLRLYSNTLTGGLPSEIANLTSLKTLNINTNQFSGPIPSGLWNITTLGNIYISNNQFTGTIPSAIGNLTALFQLILSNNQFSGGLPAEIGNLPLLTYAALDHNQFTGTIPSTFGNLYFQYLYLNNNKLVGPVPSSFASADSLYYLNLSHNSLANLPNLSALPKLTDSLYVNNNNLQFGDLEPNINIPGFAYIPQDTVDVVQSVLEQVNSNYTFSAALSGTANSYQWNKNGATIPGATTATLTFPNITFADDASYTYSATNSIVTGLTLYSHKKILRVSSLQRDSLALTALYNSTTGPGWTSKSNWTTTPIGTGNWFGVTITGNRVSKVSLPGNNLIGVVPTAFADVQNLTSVDLSTNKIQSLPDLSTLTNVTSLNVSSNHLDFASLIPNVSIPGINYSNQANLGNSLDTLINYGTNYTVAVTTKGAGNLYQWTKDGSTVTGATDTIYQITSINRGNMGTYVCQVTNPAVPSLTLQTNTQRVRAIAALSGNFMEPDSTAITKANILLLKVNLIGSYDTTFVKPIGTDGTFILNKVVLDDYVLLGKPDTTAFPKTLPSYYRSTIFWEQADTLEVQGNRSGLTIVDVTKPSPPKGKGSISGTLEDDGSSVSGGRMYPIGGRLKAVKRVAGAGVSASRAEGTGRTTGAGVLVAYTVTDQNGAFTLTGLPTGNFQLNIQYPGYPMDTASFINFSIGSSPATNQVIVNATVSGNKIVVHLVKITGIEPDERFSVYPNPTKATFNIDLDGTIDNVEYRISTVQGQPVKTGGLNSLGPNSIDVSSLASGIYIVKLLQQGQTIKSFKIVKE